MLCVVAVLLFAAPEALLADWDTLNDELGAMYSSRFFIARGRVPVMTVGLTRGVRRLRFRSRGRMRITLYTRKGKPRTLGVAPGTVCTVTSRRGRAARVKYWVAGFSLPRRDRGRYAAFAGRWLKRGYKVRRVETGVVFGLSGRVVDNRRLVGLLEAMPNAAAASSNFFRSGRGIDRFSSSRSVTGSTSAGNEDRSRRRRHLSQLHWSSSPKGGIEKSYVPSSSSSSSS